MAIESAAYFHRLTRTGLSVLIGMLSLCGVATAQVKEAATAGSIIPLQHSTSYAQIYTIDIAPNGDALFLDPAAGSGALYQLNSGSTTFQTITTSMEPSGDTYFNEGMAMDAKGTIYITARYSTPYMFRVPYNPADGTWDFNSAEDNWEPTIDNGYTTNPGPQNAVFLDSSKRDGSGLLFISDGQNGPGSLLVVPVNSDGSVTVFPSGPDAGLPQFQYIIENLKDKIMPMAVDANGNLYFIENPYDAPAKRTTGVFFIPASAYTSCMAASAAGTSDPTVPCISGTESSLQRIDPGNTEKFNGITLDAQGNVYVADASDGFGGTRNGLIEIPNESGSPLNVTAASFNFNDAEFLSPAPINANPTIDPRGFIWLPTGTSSDWNPNGGATGIPGTGNLILYQLGSANLGATPVGTPSATGLLFYTFSGSVTPGSFLFSQPGGGTDFSAVATNPYPPTTGGTVTVPCTVATVYTAFSTCEYWVGLTPQGTNSVGTVSGQLSILDSNSNLVSGSTANLTGIGEGPAAALLVPSNQTPLATGLVSPQQVAGDSLGNSYVADSVQGKVLMFAAGATTASAGTSIGYNLKAPTGVAVDNFGDVYIADSGNVFEVPAVNGVLNNTSAAQITLQTGLGSNVNLAVDGEGNVYAADPDNKRVVRIYSPQMSMVIEGVNTAGAGFTKPTAVAVDDSGNVYVADGSNLDEIGFWGESISTTGTGLPTPTIITSSLSAPVTGLAVDPSGSVYVAQKGGIIRIPLVSGSTGAAASLQFSQAAGIDSGVITPNGVGLDGLGNLYTTAASYSVSTISSTGTGSSNVTTPNVLLLSGALVNFGLVSEYTQSDPIDVDVYNIGNAPLAFTGPELSDPSFSGGDPATDFSIETDGQNPCDQSGTTTIASGAACQLGVTVTATPLGLETGGMAVTTTAVNAPTTNAVLEAWSSDLLCRTLTTITLNPSTGLTYPGSTTVTSTTTADPANPCAAGGVPEGGNITLTLQSQTPGVPPSSQTLVLLASGIQTFNLTGLGGGTYTLYVSYKGDPVYGGSSSSHTFSFVVAQAVPTIALSEPSGVSPINGTYYVLQGSTTTLQASVASSLGTPTGSVQFLNNGSAPADPTQNPVTLDGNGDATLNTSNLALGTYNLTAVYSGDGNFASITSPVVTIDVINPSVLITANPTAVSTTAGTAVSSTLTITALEGYSPQQGIQLYCETTPVDTVPPDAECTFDVPKVDIYDHPGVPQISHVTISSNIPTNEVALQKVGTSPIAFAGMLGLGLLGLTLRRKGKFHRSALTVACLMLLFAGGLVGFTGCTNSGYTHTPPAPHVTTPSGTYNMTIYALDLSTNQISSQPFTLSVTIK